MSASAESKERNVLNDVGQADFMMRRVWASDVWSGYSCCLPRLMNVITRFGQRHGIFFLLNGWEAKRKFRFQ